MELALIKSKLKYLNGYCSIALTDIRDLLTFFTQKRGY